MFKITKNGSFEFFAEKIGKYVPKVSFGAKIQIPLTKSPKMAHLNFRAKNYNVPKEYHDDFGAKIQILKELKICSFEFSRQNVPKEFLGNFWQT